MKKAFNLPREFGGEIPLISTPPAGGGIPQVHPRQAPGATLHREIQDIGGLGCAKSGGCRRVFGRSFALLLACMVLRSLNTEAELVPFEFRQQETFYNLQSMRGVPISSVSNSPAGSDGRMPTGMTESGSYNTPTINQFNGMVGFGAMAVRTNWQALSNSPLLLGANPFSASVATAMQLPRAYSNNTVLFVLRRAQVGNPYLARKVNFQFGSQVTVPANDETGAMLTTVGESYWQSEPYSTNNHLNSGYYYSPHARKVFAIQPGPITVTWRKLAPYTAANLPATYANQGGASSFETNGGSIYLLFTENYIVSGSASKPPLLMYWTEREYQVTGLPVAVPRGRVGGISIAYNNEFPRTVEEEYHGPGYTSPTEGSTNAPLAELRTLWYDQGQGFIYAYNKEGRAFVEFLGDASPDGRTREHLGYEIVDVIKQPVANDMTVELGERLVPPPPESADELFAEPVVSLDSTFVYRHNVAATGRRDLYATRETTNPNDCLVHWLEAGVAGIKWPKAFGRYHQVWPTAVNRYSQYIRPDVANEEESKATAIQLPTDNVPFIAYQDPLDRPRAKLTGEFKFYTYLDASATAHRTLLRFTSGEYVGFERVYSWLDSSLKSTNFYSSVAMNLVEVSNYVNFDRIYSDYTNSVASKQAQYQVDYAAYLVVSNTYNARALTYTNYLGVSNTYVASLAAYNSYVSASNVYSGMYFSYTNYLGSSNRYAAYTNYLAVSGTYNTALTAYGTYTNWLRNIALYTNYPAMSNAWSANLAAYNSYLATYPTAKLRGVNATWNLFVEDMSAGDSGSIGSWQLGVVTTNAAGVYSTNFFTGAGVTIPQIGTGTPYPSGFGVGGYANAVNKIIVAINGISHTWPNDLVIRVVGPAGRVATLMNVAGGGAPGGANLTLIFDDSAASALSQVSFPSGIYRPSDFGATRALPPGGVIAVGANLDALLDPMPVIVANPGAAPTQVGNPGAAPPFAAYPGAAPTVVPNPGAYPTVVANPGTAPTVVANPGVAPTVVLEPGFLPDPPISLMAAAPKKELWQDVFNSPRIVQQTVYVGNRIDAPSDEGGSGAYFAGHLNIDMGISYHPGAYIDPFVKSFTEANQGAIIPVNAIPGANKLEVWWFRTNSTVAGPNAGNNRLGFATIYWPAVVGRYTIEWPTNPREIVLASKLGSGTLNTFEALGTIYRQNDPSLPGYNPNEEHAIMAGGTAFATRDDLNLTAATNYSSHPFVLVQYTAQDGRPGVSAFKVLREKPSAGYVFDYIVPAGQLLQAPMPLPLLAKPVEGSGDSAVNYNTEPPASGGDVPGGWNPTFAASSLFGHYDSFTWRDRHNDFWVYRGPHAGLPVLKAGTYTAATKAFTALPGATAKVGTAFNYAVHASRQDEFLTMTAPAGLPDWLHPAGLSLCGTPGTNDVGARSITVVVEDLYDHSKVTNTFTLTVSLTATMVAQGPLVLPCTNSYTGTIIQFSNRPPFLALSPNTTNSFTMRYYYKTEPGFDWPGMENPPEVGTIVPYLRPINPATGAFVGNGAVRDTESLQVVYRPVWPERDPADSTKAVATLPYGATLTTPKFNLPGVKDMLTARVIYQQSLATNLTTANPSAVLHDATREKFSDLDAQTLTVVPGGVKKDYYQGRYYFPNLPPHLASRVYFDPNRGAKGSLVLKGEYVQETLGESYTMLNVLRGSDLATVKSLCPDSDPDKSKWRTLVDALATAVETFYEDPNKPGSYIPDPTLTSSVGVGDLAEVNSDNTAVDSYAISAVGPGGGYVTRMEATGTAFTQPGDPVAMHIFKVGGSSLYAGEVKVLAASNPLSEQVTFQHTADLAGRFDEFEYEWRIANPVDGMPPVSDATMSRFLALASGLDMPRRTIGGAGIQALCDNYVVMRYRAKDPAHPLYNLWSDWTSPKLAEGWIKRVLAGINPFNQRVGDLFNNQVNTDVSMLTQAGRRWEGDVALNIDTMNDYGLIEIYETVLRRGRMLSIESGYNYGPANDALLLAAGYLNDLYMMLGGEAWADAANPTIGIGTKDKTYGDIATSLFAFKGQVGNLLEEELALLRGRDDFLMPGVQVSPVYNRLVWNYTRGIDSGEVIYALNYNIQENPNKSPDGIINAEDAALMFPQGHGDAYGHYLTAMKGYYSLLLNSCFDWVPRIEAVNVLGQPVSVDYQDERKFASAAAAVGRAGRQIFDLTWRQDYGQVHKDGWAHMGSTRVNAQRKYVAPGSVTNSVTRYWGMDHWASRVAQGTYLNWVVGNSLLPDVDPNPLHEGIQKIDRTTVSELQELATTGDGIQTALDNAEGGLSPLGIPEGGIAFDINPAAVVGTESGTHFEQIYQRAKVALNNAVASFDDAKDVTRLMRSEEDSLADLQSQVASQEHAYNNSMIELYGTPYPEDVGAGKTWKQGYSGPDLIHYMYVDLPEVDWFGDGSAKEAATFKVDVQQIPQDWFTKNYTDLGFVTVHTDGGYTVNKHYLEYTIGPHGFFDKPEAWKGVRYSPGKLQQAISEMIAAHTKLKKALDDAQGDKQDFDKAILLFKADVATHDSLRGYEKDQLIVEQTMAAVTHAFELVDVITEHTKNTIEVGINTTKEALPSSFIAGLAAGGDLTAPAKAAMSAAGVVVTEVTDWTKILTYIGVSAFGFANDTVNRWLQFDVLAPMEWQQELRGSVADLGNTLNDLNDQLIVINQQLRVYEDAQRKYRALLAEGDRIQEEREIFRKRSAAVVQGYRTRDAAFRLFRNEKLERYKTLFDLSARYSLLAANAFDYETGLLDTTAGRAFKKRIINARALGVVRNGEPQYAGSNNGDPGLSSVLAEMKADWDVLRGRLGFNNPDAYGTTVSLRGELLRILPTTDGDSNWKDALQAGRVRDILEDSDVKRYCMQVDDGTGLPVPGIVINFSTTIADGYNLFGRQLAAGDHVFTPSSFATKIFGAGVALIGYRGMDNPSANSGVGGTTPTEPDSSYLDPLALSATPYVYLIPVGVDSMRSPPLGDTSTIRTWSVEDVAIPMPFNIGASDFSTKQLWQSSDSLTEPLFAIRKHQAFRPVSTTSVFSSSLYGNNGTLQRSQYTNNRLVGRSVWNSQWKLVIPGRTLLNNPSEGLDRFIQTVTDIKLHFVTYSYSGN